MWLLCAYPSFLRLILVALCLASKCRGCVVIERGVVYSRLLYCPNSQWRFPVWESCVDKLVEILLCEGGDVELCAQTSKHIRVFAIDPLTLSLTLSPSLCSLHHFILLIHFVCIISYCSFIYYMLGLFVCASLVFNHESFI